MIEIIAKEGLCALDCEWNPDLDWRNKSITDIFGVAVATRENQWYIRSRNEIQQLIDFVINNDILIIGHFFGCLLYTSPSPRDRQKSRMPSSA